MAEEKKKVDAMKIGVDTLLGAVTVLLGAAAGAAIGRPSLLAGLAVTAGGFWAKQTNPKNMVLGLVPVLGMGMMAGNGFAQSTPTTSVQGLNGALADAMERAKSFGRATLKKTYADKIPAVAKFAGVGTLEFSDMNGNALTAAQADDLIKKLSEVKPGAPVGRLNGSESSIFDDYAGVNGLFDDYSAAASM